VFLDGVFKSLWLVKLPVAIEQDHPEKLFPLLRFHTDKDLTGWTSLAVYLEKASPDQKQIYYFLGEDPSAVQSNPRRAAMVHLGKAVRLPRDGPAD